MRRMVKALAAAAIVWALPACNGDVAAGIPADFTGPGSYTVPAVPAVAFPIANVHIEQEDGAINLYYWLPAALVGQSTSVELASLEDATNKLQLSGDMGTSTCTVSVGLLSCEEHLSGIQFRALPPSLTVQEAAAAASFASDPIGVLSVPLPP
jgi:hypothetical protein